jgi:hypothetical protein
VRKVAHIVEVDINKADDSETGRINVENHGRWGGEGVDEVVELNETTLINHNGQLSPVMIHHDTEPRLVDHR